MGTGLVARRAARAAAPAVGAMGCSTYSMALGASGLLLGVLGAVVYAGGLPFADDLRTTVAAVFGAVAVVDLLLGFWFFRSSLSP